MTKYKKLQIIKHALQYYIQREGAPEKDINTEKLLLAEITEEAQKLQEFYEIPKRVAFVEATKNTANHNTQIRISIIPPGGPKARSPYDMWEEKCEELRKIVGTVYARLIIENVSPQANVYTLPVAVMRMHTIVQLAATGIVQEDRLVKIVKNHREEVVLQVAQLAAYSPSETMYQLHRMTTDELDRKEEG